MATPPRRLSVRKTYKLFIGGAFPRSESGRSLPVVDSEGHTVENYARASRKDLREAVVAARAAQPGWAGRTAFNRGQILYRMAEMLESRAAGFARALTAKAGTRAADAELQVAAAVDRLVWYAGWADKLGQVFGSPNDVASPHFNLTSLEPVGVVAAFAPRSAPLLGPVSALAPIVVTGNTCVLVVDGKAPTVAAELAEVLHTSDLPGGVVNVLTGLRDELLPHAAKHADIDALACFGLADEERAMVGREAADSVKRVWLDDDPGQAAWREEARESPYRILPFVEFKTAWHPVGM